MGIVPPGSIVEFLTTNSGGPVGPDGANNINVLGNTGNNITGVGNPGTNTLTFSVSGTTNHSLQLGNSSGSLTSLGVAGNGFLAIGSVGADPVLATLTAGTNITITNGPGSIKIDATAGSGIQTVTSNAGGAVSADGGGNITLIGGNNITGTGNPGTNTVTYSVTGTSNHQIQIGNASGSLTSLGAAINGQIPIGSTLNDPVLSTITAGSGVKITNGPGSISIAAIFPWTEVFAASAGMSANNGYISNNAGLVTLTLPLGANQGDIIKVAGKGAGGWLIAQNAGQSIIVGSDITTVGAGGSLASTNYADGVTLLCITNNTTYEVVGGIGTVTVV